LVPSWFGSSRERLTLRRGKRRRKKKKEDCGDVVQKNSNVAVDTMFHPMF